MSVTCEDFDHAAASPDSTSRTDSELHRLDTLVLELKVEIILYLSNPTLLARCSRKWNSIVNLPITKSKWLISRYGRTHALFHAVRMGEPFINLAVIECLFAQKVHISRYFIQRLFDSRPADPNSDRRPWASNISHDTFSRILQKGHERFDENDTPRRPNDMETFYRLAGGPLGISQARVKLRENKEEIETLICRYKFALFPPRPRTRNHLNGCEKQDKKIGHELYSDDTDSEPPANFDDDYPLSDGYENVRQLHVIARSILIYPELVNVWKQNSYPGIVTDVNDPVIQGSLLILYPPTPSADWVNPGLDQVVGKLKSLISLGFELTDDAIGDVLILFQRRFRDIGGILIDAFAVVRGLSKSEIISICLTELLNPQRTFKHCHSLDFVVNAIDKPEEKILATFEECGIDDPMSVYLDDNGPPPRANAILKYSPIMYVYMLIKFDATSRIARHLMKEIITSRIGEAKLRKFDPSFVLSSAPIATLWQELDYVYKIYRKAGVPLEPQYVPLINSCLDDAAIKHLFEFRSDAITIPTLEIAPFTHRPSSEPDREWLDTIRCSQNEEITFTSQLEMSHHRLDVTVLERCRITENSADSAK